MKNSRFKLGLIFLLLPLAIHAQSKKMICRQGNVTFFSYTAVENIEAANNQVVSIIDISNGEIGVQMLMRAFVFKKALMEEHFNESYVESDIYPKLTFTGAFENMPETLNSPNSIIINGSMDFHGVQREVQLTARAEKKESTIILNGDFNVLIDDFAIKVPALLVPNISKEIQVTFRFEYYDYEN